MFNQSTFNNLEPLLKTCYLRGLLGREPYRLVERKNGVQSENILSLRYKEDAFLRNDGIAPMKELDLKSISLRVILKDD